MTKLVRAVLFDLDGTLYDRDGAVRELAMQQYRAFEGELGGVSRERYVERVLELDDHGHGNRRTSYGILVRELGLGDELGERLVEYHRQMYPGLGRLFPDVRSTLDELRARGLALGLITNGSAKTQEHKLRRFGLEPFFEVVLISEREGIRKPEREIFERALSRLRVEASNAWYVGDHPMADVAGSSAAGLTAIWRYVPYWPEPASQARTIHSLGEVITLLDEGV